MLPCLCRSLGEATSHCEVIAGERNKKTQILLRNPKLRIATRRGGRALDVDSARQKKQVLGPRPPQEVFIHSAAASFFMANGRATTEKLPIDPTLMSAICLSPRFEGVARR